MKKRIALFLLMIFMLSTSAAMANDPITKLGRGFSNVITSPVEFAVAYTIVGQDANVFTALIGGTVYGAIKMVTRVLAGVYEIATFPLPIPADYRPVLEPENAIKAYQALQ